jgi:hypothetical protein
MKTRHALLALGLIATGWLALFGDKTPTDGVAEPIAHGAGRPPAPGQRASAGTRPTTAAHALDIDALIAREQLMGRGDFGGAANSANALFSSQNWNPPPAPPSEPAAAPPPSAPPLPFTYIGKKVEDLTWEVYVTRGDQTLILREKEVVDLTYRIDSIHPPTLSLTYMPLNQVQTLSIGSAE